MVHLHDGFPVASLGWVVRSPTRQPAGAGLGQQRNIAAKISLGLRDVPHLDQDFRGRLQRPEQIALEPGRSASLTMVRFICSVPLISPSARFWFAMSILIRWVK